MSAAYARARAAGLYPDDWDKISLRIRRRAEWLCECTGECGHDHQAENEDSSRLGTIWLDGANEDEMRRCQAEGGHYHPITRSKVVLTVAHLDHDPGNCDDDNLRALCQRCHLAYDSERHRQSAYAARREGKAVRDLFA